MRHLPYAQALEERRRTGRHPWLVVMEVGGAGAQSFWRSLFSLPEGVQLVRVPDEIEPQAASWRVFVALAVLLVVVDGCPRERVERVSAQLWRARVASLWRAYNGFPRGEWRAVRLYPWRRLRGLWTFWGALSHAPRLDASFREHLATAAAGDLLTREPPLYSGPEFDAAFRERWQALFGGPPDDGCAAA